MRRLSFIVHLMLGCMLLVPITYLFQATSEAAGTPSTFNSALLLSNLPGVPLFEQIHRLQRPIIATYIVKGREDLWSICKRFGVDAFSIRSSNDVDVSVFNDGTVLTSPSQKGTLYDV